MEKRGLVENTGSKRKTGGLSRKHKENMFMPKYEFFSLK